MIIEIRKIKGTSPVIIITISISLKPPEEEEEYPGFVKLVISIVVVLGVGVITLAFTKSFFHRKQL